MNTLKLLRSLAKRFPKSLKDRGDRVGLMTGKLKEDTSFIVLCLDLDEISFNKIKKFDKKPDLILTHHPFIYGTKYRVFLHDEIKKALCEEVDRKRVVTAQVYSDVPQFFDTYRKREPVNKYRKRRLNYRPKRTDDRALVGFDELVF